MGPRDDIDESEDEDVVHVSYRANAELVEQFMLAYRKAALNGYAPADGSRSEALRQLMRAMINEPSIIAKGSTDAEMERGGSP
jgi:hypothetical protein